jgi:DNA-binding SARP family transcriptional activator
MLVVYFSIWLLFLVILGMLAAYAYLIIRGHLKPPKPAEVIRNGSSPKIQDISIPPHAIGSGSGSATTESVPLTIPLVETPASPQQPQSSIQDVHVLTAHEQVPLLRIYCLGRFRVVKGGIPLDGKLLKSHHKPLRILKVISASPKQEMAQETLLDWLWDDLDGDHARAAFQKALGRLRTVLDCPEFRTRKESYVMTSGKVYRLHTDYTWVDVAEFLHQVDAGKRYRQEDRADLALSAFQKADRLWQGTLLEENLMESLMPQRKRLEETYTQLQIDTSKLLLENGEPSMAEACIKKSLAMNPFLEDAVRLLLLACHEQGKKCEALKHLNVFSSRLEREFEATPSQLTLKLGSQIRRDHKIDFSEWI